MVQIVEMEARQRLTEQMKRQGPSSIRALMTALDLSENAVRHHLHALEREGYVRLASEQVGEGAGRPAKLYALTEAAEQLFPKYCEALLELLLNEAEQLLLLEPLLGSLARRLADQIRPQIHDLSIEHRLEVTARALHLGGSLSDLEPTPGGWELRAYNCPYLAAGRKFEAVCDLFPQVITLACGLPAERVACQRNGAPACHLIISVGRS